VPSINERQLTVSIKSGEVHTVFDAFFCILQRAEDARKSIMQGCKFTWKSAFSQLGWLEEDAFEYLVTAGGWPRGSFRMSS